MNFSRFVTESLLVALEAYRQEHDGRLLRFDEREKCDCCLCSQAEDAIAKAREE